MRWSRLFGKTAREDPVEAELASHRLMLRAGLIHQAAAGVYSYLPLAWRSLRKIEQIIREEMNAAGAQEMRMPTVQPRELWDRSGRTEAYGPDLFQLTDRRDRPLVLAPTHEELLTTIVKAHVQSYRDLPVMLYQIQTKLRDEPRPRGGLIRVREFDMKDAYSFDKDAEGLDESYQAMVRAYRRIYERCGLDTTMVAADSGAIGGKDSAEFILLTDAGEDTIVVCGGCDYSANAERASFAKPAPPDESPLPVEEVHTPGVKTIQELADLLGIPASKTLKAVFYVADGEMVFVTIRGDLEVNEVKLTNLLGANDLRLATAEEVDAQGIVAGSASAVGLRGVKTVSDDSIRLGTNFAVGANRPDYHLRNVNYPRDFDSDLVADIALAEDGHLCTICPSTLSTSRGIEVGHVFKLGTRYSDALDASFPDVDGQDRRFMMGCYGIGVGRLLSAAIEQHHDESGILFPVPIAPYQVSLVVLNVQDAKVAAAADALYGDLCEAGLEVLYDDRSESAGVKFNDADLLGLPVRLVVSPRNLARDVVEVKRRSDSDARTIPSAATVSTVQEMLGA